MITAPPSEPKDLTVVKVDKDSVTLEWKQPENDGNSKRTAFIVCRREAKSDEWVKVATLKPSEMIYKITKLPEKKFYFSVAAENAAGVGPAAETEKAVKPEYPSGKRLIKTTIKPFAAQFRLLKTLKKRAFENIAEKGENTGNQHFLHFPQCFLPHQKQSHHVMSCI